MGTLGLHNIFHLNFSSTASTPSQKERVQTLDLCFPKTWNLKYILLKHHNYWEQMLACSLQEVTQVWNHHVPSAKLPSSKGQGATNQVGTPHRLNCPRNVLAFPSNNCSPPQSFKNGPSSSPSKWCEFLRVNRNSPSIHLTVQGRLLRLIRSPSRQFSHPQKHTVGLVVCKKGELSFRV